MSRIDELIAQYCPDGVEYKSLGELGGFTRGGGPQKKHLTNSGKPCIHYGQIYTHYGLYTGETLSFVSSEVFLSSRKASPGDVIIADTSENDEDLAKCVAWIGDEDVAVSNHTLIYNSPLNPKYVSYFLSSNLFQQQKRRYITGVKVRSISERGMSKAQIPVPPLEIQEEIVRILDKFTQLEAELEARRQQYEYYRDSLLCLENLIDSCGLSTGDLLPLSELTIKPDRLNWADRASQNAKYIDLSSVDRSTGKIGALTEITESDSPSRAQQIVKNNDVLFGTTRPLLRRVAYIPLQLNGEICSTGFCVLRCKNERLNPRFLYHYIQCNEFYKYVESFQSGASYPSISDKKVKDFKIPVPPLEEQERIVAILDKFDALVNDLSTGLPAEIEARRKQYEHYRDRLLSFQELS